MQHPIEHFCCQNADCPAHGVRGQNSRKTRKTYCFSKEWGVHNAAGYFIGFGYDFCRPVRTLDVKGADDRIEKRTPAIAAGLADHVWTTGEWITFPARPP
jgi:hypothetical protein